MCFLIQLNNYIAISRKVVGESARDSGFEFSFFQRTLKEFARKAIEMCLRVLKESNKSRSDSYSRQEQCIDHIPYYLSGLSRAHFLGTTFLEIAVYKPTLICSLIIHSVIIDHDTLF